jgi:hypothetical protein
MKMDYESKDFEPGWYWAKPNPLSEWTLGRVFSYDTIRGPAMRTWHGNESKPIHDLSEFDPVRVSPPDSRATESKSVDIACVKKTLSSWMDANRQVSASDAATPSIRRECGVRARAYRDALLLLDAPENTEYQSKNMARVDSLLAKFQRRVANSMSEDALYLEIVACRRAIQGVQATEHQSVDHAGAIGLRAHLDAAFSLASIAAEPDIMDAIGNAIAIMDGDPEPEPATMECKSYVECGPVDEYVDRHSRYGDIEPLAKKVLLSVQMGRGADAREFAKALAIKLGADAVDMECRSVSRVESALLDLECETQDRGDPWHNGAWYVIRKIREAFDGTDCGSVCEHPSVTTERATGIDMCDACGETLSHGYEEGDDDDGVSGK